MGHFLLASVILTVLTGTLYDKSAPYFPIEISRTATGPTSRWVFALGLSLSVILLLLERPLSFGYVVLASGVLLLAWVDDEISRFWHMVGVALLPLGAFLVVDWKKAWVPLLCAAGLYGARLVMKATAVVFLERCAWQDVASESIRIMYDGKVKEPLTLRVFEATGAMQWIVLWLLYQVVVG